MSLQAHKLEGCSPTPLASYLKALAVLRLVSEQRDPSARGFWKNEAFTLVTALSRDELLDFFLNKYAPTPILSPWNGGSGFYFREEKSKEKDAATGKLKKTGARNAPTAATRAIDTLLASTSPRLAAYAACARIAKSLLAELGFDSAPAEAVEKAALIAAFRSRLLGAGLHWIDACVTSEGSDFACAPMAGSGGNDGNEDFSKNFLVRVLDLLETDRARSRSLLLQSFFGGAAAGADDVAAGQFAPAGNGGANSGVGFEGGSAANRWDYVFALEGAILFAGASSRRLDATSSGGSFPFAVRVDPVGYGSAADADREASRAEIWLPLWARPSSLAEVCALFGEGRARIDRTDARRSTDVARAVAALGTARGVTAFERTAFLTRNGNMHYSVPLGRWPVTAQPNQFLVDDVEEWLSRFRRFARDKVASKDVTAAARAVDEALLGVCRGGGEPSRWQCLLVALGRAEGALLGSPRKAADPLRQLAPLPPLRPAWIAAANDGSPELRLAVALASQDVALRTKNGEAWLNVRAHWLPLDRVRGTRFAGGVHGAARFATDGAGLSNDPDVVCRGDDLEGDAIALVRRRVQVAPGLASRALGLVGARGAEASLGDVAAFLANCVDDRRILALARPLMALAWWEGELPRLCSPSEGPIEAAYAVARLAHLSTPLIGREPVTIALDPEPIARLAAGDLPGATATALRRIRASGISPRVRHLVGDRRVARRIAASLAFPIRAADVRRCADLVAKPFELEDHHVD